LLLLLVALAVSILLTWSYKLVEYCYKLGGGTLQSRYVLYIWAALILLLLPILKGNIVFNLPINIRTIIPALIIIFIVNYVVSRYSGYDPVGRFNIVNFAITYPIIEEIIFRGMLLPYLNQTLETTEFVEILYMPVSLPIIITAFLFAIAHLQYYKLSSQSIRYMLFAFIGGIFFGAIADLTQSIMFTLLLHIEFNVLTIYFAKKHKNKLRGA